MPKTNVQYGYNVGAHDAANPAVAADSDLQATPTHTYKTFNTESFIIISIISKASCRVLC